MHMRSYKDLNYEYNGGDLFLGATNLVSLEGIPSHITGRFDCKENKLTSLVGGPRIVDNYYICRDNQLTDLVGSPSHIGMEFDCRFNKITSLVGVHKIIKSCKYFDFDNDLILNGGIGLLLIDGLTDITKYKSPQFQIISKYLGTGTKGMMECSKELIANGYCDYAKL